MHELAVDDRISVVVLGNAVQKTMQFKVDDWTEKEEDAAWGRLPLELFVPVSHIFCWCCCSYAREISQAGRIDGVEGDPTMKGHIDDSRAALHARWQMQSPGTGMSVERIKRVRQGGLN